MNTKICNQKTCIYNQQEQPIENFYKNDAKCKNCKKEYVKQQSKTETGKLSNSKKCSKYSKTKNGKKSKQQRQLRYKETFRGRLNTMYLGAKHRAIRDGIEFNLDKEYVAHIFMSTGYRCALTNLILDFYPHPKYRRNPLAPSIDRIDSTKGYTHDNIRIICSWLNCALNEYGEDISKQIMKAYLSRQNKAS